MTTLDNNGGLKLLEVTWTNWKTCAARSSISTYYIARPGTYEVVAVDYHFIYHCLLNTNTDISDFITNYRSSATLINSVFDAIAIANKTETTTVTQIDANRNAISVQKGSAVPSNQGGVMVGGFDGTNAQLIAVDSSGRVKINSFDGSGNALTSTSNKLDVGLTGANTVKLTDSAGTNITLSGGNLKTSLFDSSGNAAIVTDAVAVPASRSVLMVAGSDGTNIRLLKTDTSGNQLVTLTGANTVRINDGSGNTIGSTSSALDVHFKNQTNAIKVSKNTTDNATSNPIYTQLSDGTSALTATSGKLDVGLTGANTVKLTDSAGTSITLSGANLKTSLFDSSGNAAIVTDAVAVPASRSVLMVAGSDGTNIRLVKTDTSGNQLVTLTGTNTVRNQDGSGNSLTSTSSALDINLKSQTNAIKVSKSTSDNAVANPIFTQLSDGSAAVGTTGNPLFVNMKDGSGNAISSTNNNLDVTACDNLGNAISSMAPGASGVRSLDVVQRGAPIADNAETVWIYNELTTTATTADQTIASYTVPAGKTFYIISWAADNINGASITPKPYRLMVDSTKKAASIPQSNNWLVEYNIGYQVATAAAVVKVTVTPSGATSTTWAARIVGVIR